MLTSALTNECAALSLGIIILSACTLKHFNVSIKILIAAEAFSFENNNQRLKKVWQAGPASRGESERWREGKRERASWPWDREYQLSESALEATGRVAEYK